ncbi:MAG TPA: hypothetical protein PLW10_08605, partial [Myxococcota bacterium]|nr:hypothetical protein [Myxococcota bacterium]
MTEQSPRGRPRTPAPSTGPAPARVGTRRTGCLVLALALGAWLPALARAGAPGPEEPPPGLARSTGTESPSSAPADPSLPPPAPERGRPDVAPLPPAPVLDPSARWLDGDDASEYWTLYVELDSGHRISQRFLLTNAGPGEHTAVAVGHLTEPGRPPFRYENGRREGSWTASPDRLFFDIAASHLDLHRPRGELRITKDEIEIRLFFDFPERGGVAVPRDRLPPSYAIDVLAIASPTEGTILAPWMTTPLATRGRTWLAHTWMSRDEAVSLFEKSVPRW